MNMPEVDNFFGFPLRFGNFLISTIGLGIGGIGITSIVMFALIEKLMQQEFKVEFDQATKKIVLMSVGMTSILMLVANGFLLLGVMTASGTKVAVGKWVTFIQCMLLLVGLMSQPLLCWYQEQFCLIIRSFTIPGLLVIYSFLGIFIQIWLYFMVVMHNFESLI